MFKKLFRTILLIVTLLALTAVASAAEPSKKLFDESNVAIITAAPKDFTQQELDSITPYIRAKMRFPDYSIQSNEIVPYGSITEHTELAKIAKEKNADILLFMNIPVYEEYMVVSMFGNELWYVNVNADIYLYDTKTKSLQIKKVRYRDSGNYGSIRHPNEVMIKALTDALDKLPTTIK